MMHDLDHALNALDHAASRIQTFLDATRLPGHLYGEIRNIRRRVADTCNDLDTFIALHGLDEAWKEDV